MKSFPKVGVHVSSLVDWLWQYGLDRAYSSVLRERRRIFGDKYPQSRETFTYIRGYFTVLASSSLIILWIAFSVVVKSIGESLTNESLSRAFLGGGCFFRKHCIH